MARRATREQATLFSDATRAPLTDAGVLYRDDNLRVLSDLPSESVDLIYLDPPFFSNRIYEVIWGEEAEVRSFEDRWAGGIQHYIDWMEQRAHELHRVLKPKGSLYLHCDPHASHYLKVMLDGVFGPKNFRNEVIWKRTAAKGDARRKFGAIHDVLLLYGKTSDAYFEPARRAPDAEYEGRFKLDDHDGRGPYRIAPLDSPNPRPNLTYEYKGYHPPRKGWRVKLELMKRLDDEGRLAFPRSKEGRIGRKHYLREQKWPTVGDVWTDIKPLQSGNRIGYPTEKPPPLLSRIIAASSREGDLVLDPFCGCGTTVAVADLMERKYIGIDISATAITIMERRLLKQGSEKPRIVNAVETIAQLKALKPFEFQNWIINAIFGSHSPRKVHDMGIDGYSFFTKDPVQVKQSEQVGRNAVDNFETAIRRAGHTTGFIIAFSFGRGAVEEAARAKRDGLDIRLVKAAEVLIGVKRPHGELPLPQPATVQELPLPPIRKPKDLPTATELIESDLRTGTDEEPVRRAATVRTRGPKSSGRARPLRR